MKRRLNILCLVVMLVLSYSVLEQGVLYLSGSQDGGRRPDWSWERKGVTLLPTRN